MALCVSLIFHSSMYVLGRIRIGIFYLYSSSGCWNDYWICKLSKKSQRNDGGRSENIGGSTKICFWYPFDKVLQLVLFMTQNMNFWLVLKLQLSSGPNVFAVNWLIEISQRRTDIQWLCFWNSKNLFGQMPSGPTAPPALQSKCVGVSGLRTSYHYSSVKYGAVHKRRRNFLGGEG